MRSRWAALVLLSSACSAFGTAADAGGTVDAAANGDASTDGDATRADDRSFCATARKDAAVKKCIDFDEPTSQSPPRFGFEKLTSNAQLDSSFLDAGRSLRIALGDAATSRSETGSFAALSGAPFSAPTRLVLDGDVVVDELTLDYVALAAFQLVGDKCAHFPGLAVGRTDLLIMSDGDPRSVGGFKLGTPFHFRLIVEPSAGHTTNEELFINGASVATAPIAYESSCNYAAAWIGTFFTSTNYGHVRVRFDRIVLRVE
jgi:hypothetical protein